MGNNVLVPIRRRTFAVVFNFPKMSGINGGIEYSLDLSVFSPEIQDEIRSLQKGVLTPAELIETTRAIASCKDERILPVLVDILGFNNPVAAKIALQAIVGFGAASKNFLVKATGAFNYAVNAYALKALGLLGFPDTFEICAHHAVEGTVPNVRRAAIIAIGRLHYPEAKLDDAIESLFASLCETDWSVRYPAVVSVESLFLRYAIQRENRISTKLKEMANSDDDLLVRCRAEMALRRLGIQMSPQE